MLSAAQVQSSCFKKKITVKSDRAGKEWNKGKILSLFCRWEIEAWLTEVKQVSVIWKLSILEVNGRAETLKFPAFICPSWALPNTLTYFWCPGWDIDFSGYFLYFRVQDVFRAFYMFQTQGTMTSVYSCAPAMLPPTRNEVVWFA